MAPVTGSAVRPRRRIAALDALRGLTLLSMIAYHTCWDLVYLFRMDWEWYRGTGAYIWQQSICWTFILLSGFCWSMGRHPLRRGLTVFACGWIVTLVTVVFLPEEQIWFGVLTLIGGCMLLLIPLERALGRVPAGIGLAAAAVLFVLLRNVNRGTFGFESLVLGTVPQGLYRNLLTAWLAVPVSGGVLPPPPAGAPAGAAGPGRPPVPAAVRPGAVVPAGVYAPPAGGLRRAAGGSGAAGKVTAPLCGGMGMAHPPFSVSGRKSPCGENTHIFPKKYDKKRQLND